MEATQSTWEEGSPNRRRSSCKRSVGSHGIFSSRSDWSFWSTVFASEKNHLERPSCLKLIQLGQRYTPYETTSYRRHCRRPLLGRLTQRRRLEPIPRHPVGQEDHRNPFFNRFPRAEGFEELENLNPMEGYTGPEDNLNSLNSLKQLQSRTQVTKKKKNKKKFGGKKRRKRSTQQTQQNSSGGSAY